MEKDQQKQIGYVMDLLAGGRPAIQYEVNGAAATKPPLYNWLAALTCLVFGTTAPWAMKLPNLLAGAGLLVLIFLITRRLFDPAAAFWAVAACLASFHFVRLIWIARTDMVMVAGLYLALYLVLSRPPTWRLSLVVGLIMGLNFLTKGPPGPIFFLIWLAVLVGRAGTLTRAKTWLELIPGLVVFLALSLAWLGLVWQAPGFQERVVGDQVLRRLPLVGQAQDAWYLYLTWLLARIAPWPLVALFAFFKARTRPESGPALRVGLAGLALLLFLSLVGVKRHDLLLPVYPAVFILAGLGLKYLIEPPLDRTMVWLIRVLALVLVALPLIRPLIMSGPMTPLAGFFLVLTGLAGLLALWMTRRGPVQALIPLLAGLVLVHGLYPHGLANPHPVGEYALLREFAAPLRGPAQKGEVLLWGAPPLIWYELGLHGRPRHPVELKADSPRYLVLGPNRAEVVRIATGWRLKELAALKLDHHWENEAILYQVLPGEPEKPRP
jgi:4-amino-4-deoxy-L-arabinose transferase-like glycosyltransferase